MPRPIQASVGKHSPEPPRSPAFCDRSMFDRQEPVRSGRGFSLLEIMIVLLILATAAATVFPNLISWRVGLRLQGAINELLGNLQSAKALAAKHNTTVSVQFAPAENRYQISYVDSDGQIVTLKQEALAPEIRIDTSHPDYSLTNHRMAFTARGGATPGTLVVSSLSKKCRKIIISSMGKIRTEN